MHFTFDLSAECVLALPAAPQGSGGCCGLGTSWCRHPCAHTHTFSKRLISSLAPLQITKPMVAWLSFFPVGRTTGSGGFTFPAALGGQCAKSAQCSRPKYTCLDNALAESPPCLQPSLGNRAGIWGSAAPYVQIQWADWAPVASNHVPPAGGQRRGRNEGDAWGKRLSGELPARTELGRCHQPQTTRSSGGEAKQSVKSPRFR